MSKSFQELFNGVAEVPEPKLKTSELTLPEPQDVSVPREERNQRELQKAESRLYEKSVTLLDASVSTFELTDQELQAPEPPERWVREAGGDKLKAWERFNIARNARLSKRDAPIALDLAKGVHTTIIRARSMDKQKNAPLNAIVVNMQLAAPPQFKEREVVETSGEDDWGDV